MKPEPTEPDAIETLDDLADRLTSAIAWIAAPGGSAPTAQVSRDARHARALAAVVTSLALVSIARDVHRVVDLAAEWSEGS